MQDAVIVGALKRRLDKRRRDACTSVVDRKGDAVAAVHIKVTEFRCWRLT